MSLHTLRILAHMTSRRTWSLNTRFARPLARRGMRGSDHRIRGNRRHTRARRRLEHTLLLRQRSSDSSRMNCHSARCSRGGIRHHTGHDSEHTRRCGGRDRKPVHLRTVRLCHNLVCIVLIAARTKSGPRSRSGYSRSQPRIVHCDRRYHRHIWNHMLHTRRDRSRCRRSDRRCNGSVLHQGMVVGDPRRG